MTTKTTKRGKRWVLHTGAMSRLLKDVREAVEKGKYDDFLRYSFGKYRKYYREVELCPKKQ